MKIHIFLRQTSHNNPNSPRPEWIDYEKCFKNLLKTIDFNTCNLTVSFDGDIKGHFTNNYSGFKIIQTETLQEDPTLKSGWSNSTKFLCQQIYEQSIDKNDLIYMVDNDYLHLKHWPKIVLNLFDTFILERDKILVSLYDHPDKYMFTNHEKTDHWGMYKNLSSKIVISGYRHWRTVPSICQSWIMTKYMFDSNFDVFKDGLADNTTCGELSKRGIHFLTPMPTLSTHLSVPFLSPFVDWKGVQNLF